jgi:hypothetical protein
MSINVTLASRAWRGCAGGTDRKKHLQNQVSTASLALINPALGPDVFTIQ